VLGGLTLAGAVGNNDQGDDSCTDGLAASLGRQRIVTPVLNTAKARSRPRENAGTPISRLFSGRRLVPFPAILPRLSARRLVISAHYE